MKEVSLLPPSFAGETGPNAESVRRVLDSRTFEKTPALRALLEYLWHHREEAISEYAIATEALGRPPSFDARTDATVRVQISRLRQRLEKFYEDEGQRCAERLIIPLGSHRVEVEECPQTLVMRATESPVITPAPVVVDVPAKEAGWRRFLPIAVVVMVVICLAQAAILWQLKKTLPPARTQTPGWIWKKLFANARRTRIILPMPIFFSFTRPGADIRATVMLRDTEVNEFSRGPTSSAYEVLHRDLGEPKLAESYTVTSDTFASVELVRYLDRVGLNTSFTSSADAPLEALDSENVVALGTWGTLTPLKPYLETMSFELGTHEDYVVNRRPKPGEPARYSLVTESEDRSIWPGVIAFLPGSAANTHLMILASRHTSALVSFLTSTYGQEMLERMWKQKGSPEFFEVVVNSEMGGRGLVRFWPVTLHPYKKKP
jgi:hypothetical protein